MFFQGVKKETIAAYREARKESYKLYKGSPDDIDWDKVKPAIGCMARDILVQKKRIGGDFVVAHRVSGLKVRRK